MISRFNSAKSGYGDAYLLITILAAVLGGTDAYGGFGRVSGLVLALVILQFISSGLNLIGVSAFFTLSIWGLIMILVMAANFFSRRYQFASQKAADRA
jgi:simple sugar transport system permease protein